MLGTDKTTEDVDAENIEGNFGVDIVNPATCAINPCVIDQAGYQPEVAYIPWAHSIYLELLAERGLVGFLAFGALIAAMVRRTAGAVRDAVSEPQRLYAAALAGSLASFLMMGVFDLTFLKDWVSLMFWLLAALCARIDDAFTSAAEPVRSGQPS